MCTTFAKWYESQNVVVKARVNCKGYEFLVTEYNQLLQMPVVKKYIRKFEKIKSIVLGGGMYASSGKCFGFDSAFMELGVSVVVCIREKSIAAGAGLQSLTDIATAEAAVMNLLAQVLLEVLPPCGLFGIAIFSYNKKVLHGVLDDVQWYSVQGHLGEFCNEGRGTQVCNSVGKNGEVIVLLDIFKCLYDTISRMDEVVEFGSVIDTGVEGVECKWGIHAEVLLIKTKKKKKKQKSN